MHYLKKVIAVIPNRKCRESAEKLGELLRDHGILFESAAGNVAESVKPGNTEGCLYLTDSAVCAAELCRQGGAVLAVLHEENRNQDFSRVSYACEHPEELDDEYMERIYRRYKRLPWDILETERCLIRETTVTDIDAFYEIYKEPEITRYTEGLCSDRQQEIKYINDYIDLFYGFYDFGIWTIIEKISGNIIGRAGLSMRDGSEEPEIGFVIGLPWQGRGFAEEVCRAILEYGREEFGFTKVCAFVKPENASSLRLCAKLGMERDGEMLIEQRMHYRMCWQCRSSQL